MVVDKCSRSNAEQIQIRHIDWMVNVNFKKQVLDAKATYKLSSSDSKELILDTNNLIIKKVCDSSGNNLTYELLPGIDEKPHLGRALVITLPKNNNTDTISIEYVTTEKCSALQWLPPSQTAGKIYPYMFTQCQAIHGRSLIPCQDVTRVKFTYTATVTTPSWATAVLSAVQDETLTIRNNKNNNNITTVWKQNVPISSYLLALAVGQLEKRDLSKRCAVYCEPSVVDAAAYEFAETETFLQIAEQIAGTPYQWGRYDLLCLPPSFSYGGMENPNMTFVTPTLLAGDRSLAGVVAHEIAHSWTGNYVTCSTWEDFWLNEGWTVWLERKIASKLHGPKYLDFEAIGGFKDLADAVRVMPREFTSLVLPMGDCDPDDAYSTIAYEKGFNLLLYLERKVGTDKFEKFFQDYIKHFANKTLSSDEFRDYFIQYFEKDDKAKTAIAAVDWQKWYHEPGMPPAVVDYDRSLAESAENLAKLWLEVDQKATSPPDVSVKDWSSHQITCFLDEMLSLTSSANPLKNSTLKEMDTLYGFAQTKNAEILLRFCRLAIAAEDETILPIAIRFVTSQGRMKFIRPIYKALYESKMGKDIAVQTFLDHRDFYHPIGAKMVAQDLMVSMKDSSTTEKSARSDGGNIRLLWIAGFVALSATAAFVVLRRRR